MAKTPQIAASHKYHTKKHSNFSFRGKKVKLLLFFKSLCRSSWPLSEWGISAEENGKLLTRHWIGHWISPSADRVSEHYLVLPDCTSHLSPGTLTSKGKHLY